MKKKQMLGSAAAGFTAGAVNGLFATGGGMILVPLLTRVARLRDTEVFPSSVSIILPVCMVSLAFSWPAEGISFSTITPYILGSAVGGIAAGIWGRKLPVLWLHRILGLLILWGGIRYLC